LEYLNLSNTDIKEDDPTVKLLRERGVRIYI